MAKFWRGYSLKCIVAVVVDGHDFVLAAAVALLKMMIENIEIGVHNMKTLKKKVMNYWLQM